MYTVHNGGELSLSHTARRSVFSALLDAYSLTVECRYKEKKKNSIFFSLNLLAPSLSSPLGEVLYARMSHCFVLTNSFHVEK